MTRNAGGAFGPVSAVALSSLPTRNLVFSAHPTPYSSALTGVPWQKGYPEYLLPLPGAGRKGTLPSSLQDLESQVGQWAIPVGPEAGRGLQVTGIIETVGGHFKSLALFLNMETLTSAPRAGWSYGLSKQHLDPNIGLNSHSEQLLLNSNMAGLTYTYPGLYPQSTGKKPRSQGLCVP